MKRIRRLFTFILPVVLLWACSRVSERVEGMYKGEFHIDTIADSGYVIIELVDEQTVNMKFDFDSLQDISVNDIAVVGDDSGYSFYGYRLKNGMLSNGSLELLYDADSADISFNGVLE